MNLSKQRILSILLLCLFAFAITGCNGNFNPELEETAQQNNGSGAGSGSGGSGSGGAGSGGSGNGSGGGAPIDPTTGTWANKDEDGDGTNDEFDDYPFDSTKTQFDTYEEQGFNDNPGVANNIEGEFPFRIVGKFDEPGDGDVFRLTVGQNVIDSGRPVTFLVSMSTLSLTPTLSLLDGNGDLVFEIENNSQPLGRVAELVSINFTAPGTYYIAIAEVDQKFDTDFNYEITAFYDEDYDAVHTDLEYAIGSNPTHPDSDSDGIHDGNEFYVYPFGELSTDVDLDDIPNWADLDSDNDGLSDVTEGLIDVDKDGLGAFSDLDSDGNTIEDAVEVVDLEDPLDTDKDNTPDFLDLDDDSDRLFDVKDSNRLVKLTQTEDFSVYAVKYTDQIGVELTDRVFPGERVTVIGENLPLSNFTLVMFSGDSVFNIDVTDSTGDEFSFYVPENAREETEYEYFIAQADKMSKARYFNVSSHLTPILNSIPEVDYNIGDEIVLSGRNFHSSTLVFFNDVQVVPEEITDTTLKLTIPQGVASGFIHLESLQLKSNKVGVTIVDGIQLSMDDEVGKLFGKDFKIISGRYNPEESKFINSTNVIYQSGDRIPYRLDQSGKSILNLAFRDTTGNYSKIIPILIKKDDKEIQVNSLKILESFLYSMPAIEQSFKGSNSHWAESLQSIDDASSELAIALLQSPVVDKKDKLISFLGESAKHILSGNFAESPQKQEPTNLYLTKSDESVKPTINPETGYFDEIGMSPTRKAFAEEWYKALEYDGYMEVHNRSQLLLSAAVYPMNKNLEKGNDFVTDSSGKTYSHIQDFFDRDIIGAQYLQLMGIDIWSQDVTIKACPYTDCVYAVLSPGYAEPYATEVNQAEIRAQLYLRSLIERGIWPSIKLIFDVIGLSNKLPDGPMTKLRRGKNVVEIILTHGLNDIDFIRDTVVPAMESGNWTQAVEAIVWGRIKTMLDFEMAQLGEGKAGPLLTALLNEMGIDPISVGEALLKTAATRLIPFVGQVKVVWDILKGVDAAADIAKFWWDLNKVGGQYDFYVNWGMKIISLKPGVVAAENKDTEVIIRGAGFRPVDNWWPWSDEHPIVRIYDQGNSDNEIELDEKHYVVNDWGTEITVTIPGNYLESAIGDLRVEVEHRDQIAKSTDYSEPRVIKIGSGLVVDRLYPDSGAPGDRIELKGVGFDNTVEIWFTTDSGQARATTTKIDSDSITLIVPNSAISGTVTVRNGAGEQDTTLFELVQGRVLIQYGDNGNLADDIFGLSVDQKQTKLMLAGARQMLVDMPLTPGQHEVELKGIEAPDDIGTYYICFSNNVSILPGSHATNGRDLKKETSKSFRINVTNSSSPSINQCSSINRSTQKVRILNNE